MAGWPAGGRGGQRGCSGRGGRDWRGFARAFQAAVGCGQRVARWRPLAPSLEGLEARRPSVLGGAQGRCCGQRCGRRFSRSLSRRLCFQAACFSGCCCFRSGLSVTAPAGVQFRVAPEPALWHAGAGILVQRMSAGQYLAILTSVALSRCHEAKAAMPMLVVVPANEIPDPAACGLQVGKALLRPLRAVFQRPEQRLRVRIVKSDSLLESSTPNPCEELKG